MAFDTKAWLTDELGFSEEEAKNLLPMFEPRNDKLEKNQLRQSDYSKHMNELQATQAQLKTNTDRLNAEMAEWAELKGADESEAAKVKEQLERTQTENFQLTQKVRDLATKAGVDPATVLPKPGEVVPEKKPEPVAFDPTPIQQQIGGISNYLLTLNAELPMIQAEHRALTGHELDTRAFIAEIKARAARKEDIDPTRLWESLNDIPAKRAAKADEQKKADLKAAEDRGYERARSEAAIPGQQAPGTHAPIFKGDQGRTSKLQRPQPGQGTSQFAASLASGKYRQVVGKR